MKDLPDNCKVCIHAPRGYTLSLAGWIELPNGKFLKKELYHCAARGFVSRDDMEKCEDFESKALRLWIDLIALIAQIECAKCNHVEVCQLFDDCRFGGDQARHCPHFQFMKGDESK